MTPTRWTGLLLVTAVLLQALPADAQSCLHGEDETSHERTRRVDALTAVRLINTYAVQGRVFDPPRRGGTPRVEFPAWDELKPTGDWKMDVGPMGMMARRMKWGTPEPLPGWLIHYVTDGRSYAFALRDMTDPCGFTFWSDNTGVIRSGTPVR